MQIKGRELYFAYTVGAKKELDRLIAAHGGRNLHDLVTSTPEAQEAGTLGTVLILSKWGEKLRAEEEPGYEPRPLTEAELELFTVGENAALFEAALEAMTRDSTRDVEAEAPQQAQKKTGEGGPSS